MTKDEALKMAIEALSILKPDNWLDKTLQGKAWQACKEALEQPVVKDYLTVQPLSDEAINTLWYESNNDVLGVSLGYTTQQHYFARAIEKRILAR